MGRIFISLLTSILLLAAMADLRVWAALEDILPTLFMSINAVVGSTLAPFMSLLIILSPQEYLTGIVVWLAFRATTIEIFWWSLKKCEGCCMCIFTSKNRSAAVLYAKESMVVASLRLCSMWFYHAIAHITLSGCCANLVCLSSLAFWER